MKGKERRKEIAQALLDSLSFYTKSFFAAQASKERIEVVSSLDQHCHMAYDLCLAYGIPPLQVAKRFVEDTPPERRSLPIEALRKKLNPYDYRELANHFGIRR